MKAVLISIRPEWCEKIASGQKTIDVRKTKPKLENPFKCYIYCTKVKESDKSGKVIGEFVCDKIYDLAPLNHAPDDVENQSCLNRDQIVNYLKGKGYGWHISNLLIYSKPKDIKEFRGLKKTRFGGMPYYLHGAPRSWCYVEELEDAK